MSGTNRSRATGRRTAAGLTLSLAVHALAAWLFQGHRQTPIATREPPIEIVVVEPKIAPPPPAPAPGPPSAPTRRRAPAIRPSASASPSPSAIELNPAPDDTPSLLRMRGPIDLTPGADTLARALGPTEAPPSADQPRRKPRLPGTGLTTLTPEIDDKVRLIHPRFYEVLTKTEKLFHPERIRMADEVRGDLSASTSIKRWLFGGLAGDPEALRNQVPSLACLVCVTLRPGVTPEIELAGPSGSPWFDRAARDSLERASVPERPDEALNPARACYRFAAKVWRTRPDLTNLAIPFQLNFYSTVRLVSYRLLGS